jgi:hypothetical protein
MLEQRCDMLLWDTRLTVAQAFYLLCALEQPDLGVAGGLVPPSAWSVVPFTKTPPPMAVVEPLKLQSLMSAHHQDCAGGHRRGAGGHRRY